MILRVPDFYKDFKCLADKCSDTCCVGWEIDVDSFTLDFYKNVPGEFGKRLRENLEEDHFKLCKNDRCPFLDDKNLCEIYKNLGEDALCEICTEHPRFVEVYGDIMEKGLGLCCEEAVHLLLKNEKSLEFEEIEIDEEPEELSIEELKIRDEIFLEREKFFKILADKNLNFSEKLEGIFGKISNKFICPSKDFLQKILELLLKTESYGKVWEESLSCIQKRILDLKPGEILQGNFSESESLRIISYLIYRYYAKCLYEGFAVGKLRFSILFWCIANYFTNELAKNNSCHLKVEAIKLLSKQLEYSEDNMVLLESSLELME